MVPRSNVKDLQDEIGMRLQAARNTAGLTVEDVTFRVRIPRSVIVALEAGDFSAFPGPSYAKSFLSQYSEFLNVDATVWLDALQPAPFVVGEIARPFMEVIVAKNEEKIPERGVTSGWLSGVGVLILSCGLVYSAIRGYDYFEARLGGATNVGNVTNPSESKLVPVNSASSPAAPSSVATQAVPKKPDDDFSAPPPRAIIVR